MLKPQKHCKTAVKTMIWGLQASQLPIKIQSKNKAFSIVELKEELLKILKNNDSIEIYVRADKGVIFGEVAKLMSLLQELKPDSINFITEPVDD